MLFDIGVMPNVDPFNLDLGPLDWFGRSLESLRPSRRFGKARIILSEFIQLFLEQYSPDYTESEDFQLVCLCIIFPHFLLAIPRLSLGCNRRGHRRFPSGGQKHNTHRSKLRGLPLYPTNAALCSHHGAGISGQNTI